MDLSVAEVWRALRERWWILVAAAVVAAATAFAVTKLPFVEPRWRSSVWVQAVGRLDYGNSLAVERQLRPLTDQIRQLSIMRQVDQNLHLDLPAQKLLENTKAEPVQDSSEIRIDVDDADPVRAERTAVEIARVYSQVNNASQQGLPRQEQLLFIVLDRPSAAALVWPQTRVLVPGAALLGLIAAAAVIAVLVALDDTLRSGADVQALLGLPVLGAVPNPAAGGRGRPRRMPGRSPRDARTQTSQTAAAGQSTPASPASTSVGSR